MPQFIDEVSIDKSHWPRGPWDQEPDKRQWTDEATGLPCVVARNPQFGNLNGYVGLSKGHRLWGVDHDEIDELLAIDVHGGLTFSGFCYDRMRHQEDSGEHMWWLGFDFAHAGDAIPSGWAPVTDEMRAVVESIFPGLESYELEPTQDVYATIDDVAAECEKLARQLSEIYEP